MKKLILLSSVFGITVLNLPCAQAQIFEMGSLHGKAAAGGAGAAAAVAASQKKQLTDVQRKTMEAQFLKTKATAAQLEKTGKLADAADLYVQMATDREKLSGTKHADVAKFWSLAGDLYCKSGSHSKAENCYRSEMKVVSATSGSQSPAVLTVLNKLSQACLAGGNFEEADSFGTQMLSLSEKVYGAGDERTADARSKLSSTLKTYADKMREYGDEAQAKAIDERAAKLTATVPQPAQSGATHQ